MKSRFSPLLCAAALSLVLSGCGGPAPAAPSTSPSPESPDVTVPSESPSAYRMTPMPSPSESDISTSEPKTSSDGSEESGSGPQSAAPAVAPLPGDLYDWIDRDASVTFGGPAEGFFLAVQDVRVGLNDLSVALIPRGTGADISAFLQAEDRLPVVTVRAQSDANVLTIQLKNTVLDSGDPVESSGNDDWVFDFIEEYGLNYPSSFPRGAVGEANRFFQNTAISTNGTGTTITVLLSDEARRYRIESGSLDSEGMLPYFRVVFTAEAADREN